MAKYRTISAMSSSLSMRVNPMSSLARELKCWPIMKGGVLIDLLSGLRGDVEVGTMTSEFTRYGLGSTSAASTRVNIPITHNIGAGPFTMACRYRSNNLTGSFHTVLNLPNNDEFGMYIPVSGGSRFVASDSTAGLTQNWSNSPVVEGEWQTYTMGSTGAGDQPNHYRNGVLQIPTGTARFPNYDPGTTDFMFFSGQGAEYAVGTVDWASLWSRSLSDVEQYELYRDHMQMFTETRRVMWAPFASVAAAPFQPGAYWM